MGNNYPSPKGKCVICGGTGILLIQTQKGWMNCRYCKGTGKYNPLSRSLRRVGEKGRWQSLK